MQRRPVAGHTWALGAVAALVDTARAAARSVVQLDVRVGDADEPFLVLRDDGPGLSYFGVRSRLGATAPVVSARVRDGRAVADPTPAQLPTPEKGFAGTPWLGAVFRLGRDVCLLSKTRGAGAVVGAGDGASDVGTARIIALLSRTGAVDGSLTSIVVVNWDRNPEEKAKAMQSLLTYSPWNTEEEITAAFDSVGETGLLVAVFNLRRTVEEAVLELDVESDETDILLDPPEDLPGEKEHVPVQPLTVHTSMRAYLQVLYLESSTTELKPGTSRGPRLFLRGIIVREMRVCASLLRPFDYAYVPRQQPQEMTRFRLGINSSYAKFPVGAPANALTRRDAGNPDAHATLASDQDWGMLVYCHGRLVWPYVRFSAHEAIISEPTGEGNAKRIVGRDVVPVVGIVEADAWIANPNAQGFTATELLKRSKTAIERNMTNYISKHWSQASPLPHEEVRPAQTWARCDECNAWRVVPKPPTPNMCDVHIVPKWVCAMNAGGEMTCNGRDDEFEAVQSKGKGRITRASTVPTVPQVHHPSTAYPPTAVAVPKRARGRPRKVPEQQGSAVKRIRIGNEWHEAAPASSAPSETLSEQQAAAFADAEECVSPGPFINGHHLAQMALPAGVGSLPPHGTVGDDGEFVPELDLNARTPEPHELPIPDDIASPDNFVLSGNVEEQQRELDRLHVDNVDEARDCNANAVVSVGALDAALLGHVGSADGAAADDDAMNGSVSPKTPLAGWTEDITPASAQNEAAVALVAMNRAADCEPETFTPAEVNQRAARDSSRKQAQAESDEVGDAIAAVEDGETTPLRPDAEADGASGIVNGGVGPGAPTEPFAAYPDAHPDEGTDLLAPQAAHPQCALEASAPHYTNTGQTPTRNGTYDDGAVAEEEGRLGSGACAGNGPSEHRSEGSKGPSHRPPPNGARVGASGARRESGDGSFGGVPGDMATVNIGGDERVASGDVNGGDAGGSGLGSGSGMGGGGETGAGDGRWRAKFLELAALLDEDRQPRGLMPPLQSVGIEEADALVKELKQHVTGISDEAITARAEQTVACEQLDGVRRLIRVFLERGVGIVRPEDDEDEPIESHFSAYLRMIDVLQGSTELA